MLQYLGCILRPSRLQRQQTQLEPGERHQVVIIPELRLEPGDRLERLLGLQGAVEVEQADTAEKQEEGTLVGRVLRHRCSRGGGGGGAGQA